MALIDPPAGTRVGIWTRTAAYGEDPSGVAQEKSVRISLSGMDWEMVEVYRLECVSDDDLMDHPENQRMLADVRSGHIQLLACYSIDQMTNHNRDLFALVTEISQAGIRLMTLDGYFSIIDPG
jgi:DNA invertase Pin-like site-specific DNA recombinase